MDCPACHRPTRVLESRRAPDGSAVRRRRQCADPECGQRFTTFERAVETPMQVIKRDGSSQRFDRTKLRAALLHSAHKRPVSAENVERLVDQVAAAISAAGGELEAERIGELCLAGLERLDRGAYLQFLGTLPGTEAESNPDFAGSAGAGSVRPASESAWLPAQTG